jgi:hypothetical protein
MKQFFAVLSVIAVSGMSVSGAWAQSVSTTQSSTGGTTGNPDYPLEVTGTDGLIYQCEADIVQLADGNDARTCIRPTDTAGSVFENATPLQQAGAAVGIIVVGAALANSSSSSSTTTTN